MSQVNPLFTQATAAAGPPYSGEAHYQGWDLLRDQWARLNGLRRTTANLKLDALRRGLRSGGAWGEASNWPDGGRDLCDHPSFFKRDGVAAAITTEPYGTHDFEALGDYAARHGLITHTPPNPRASFWFPGWTYLVVLTRPDFGEVRWLDDQISFTGLGPYATTSAQA